MFFGWLSFRLFEAYYNKIKLNKMHSFLFSFYPLIFFPFNFGLWNNFFYRIINIYKIILVNYIPFHSISFLPFHLSLYIHRIKEQNLIRNYMQSAHVLFSFNPRRWLACVIPPGYARWDRIVLQGLQDGKQIWSVRYGPF